MVLGRTRAQQQGLREETRGEMDRQMQLRFAGPHLLRGPGAPSTLPRAKPGHMSNSRRLGSETNKKRKGHKEVLSRNFFQEK